MGIEDTGQSGLISEHHSHADLQLLLSPIGREPHQILIIEVEDKKKKAAITCVCGKTIRAFPLDDCYAAFERHFNSAKASNKRWSK